MSKMNDLIADLLSTDKWTVLFLDEYDQPDEPPVSIGVYDSKEEALEAAGDSGGNVYPPLNLWLSGKDW